MSNLRFGYLNHADSAVLTSSPIMADDGPVTYLQSDARGDICQAAAGGSQIILGTWGGVAHSITEFCLWRHNLAYNDTIRLEGFGNADWTSSSYDSTALAAYTATLFDNWGWGFWNSYFIASFVGWKSFQITINSAAAFQAARLYLGTYVEAPINPEYGYVPGRDTNTKQNRSEGASLRSIRKGDWRTAAFDMAVETEADYAKWDEIGRSCGTWGSFVSSLYPGAGGTQERNNTLFGKFEKHPGQKISGPNHWDFWMKIIEI